MHFFIAQGNKCEYKRHVKDRKTSHKIVEMFLCHDVLIILLGLIILSLYHYIIGDCDFFIVNVETHSVKFSSNGNGMERILLLFVKPYQVEHDTKLNMREYFFMIFMFTSAM